MARLEFGAIPGAEIVHHAGPQSLSTSRANWIRWVRSDDDRLYRLPWRSLKRVGLPLRLLQRLLRLHKCNVFPVLSSGQWSALVVIRDSVDGGRSWEIIFEFLAGKARHVHGCFWDRFEGKVWVCTGDFADENHVIVADEEFRHVERSLLPMVRKHRGSFIFPLRHCQDWMADPFELAFLQKMQLHCERCLAYHHRCFPLPME